jgi:hypothetical protein
MRKRQKDGNLKPYPSPPLPPRFSKAQLPTTPTPKKGKRLMWRLVEVKSSFYKQVIDTSLRLLVLEGLRGGSLPLLEAKLREQQRGAPPGVTILMNPDLSFRDRLYGTLGADVQVGGNLSKVFYVGNHGYTFWQWGSEEWE